MTSILPVVVIILFALMAISSYLKKKRGDVAAVSDQKPAMPSASKREAAPMAAADRVTAPPHGPVASEPRQAAAEATSATSAAGCCPGSADSALAAGIPEDSMLRRHYDQLVASKRDEDCSTS